MFYCLFLMVFLGFLCLCLVRKHVFLCLISLEFIIIYLLVIVFMYCLMYYSCMYMYILMMTFFVCEGALGLGLMILFVRCHSNDYLNSMMLW
uniref:NADH-ubiquinone oxidoreductase chain 4L n=1 Tax=Entylia carinata TaxID=1464891 RepID=A0A343AXP9_ENTCR|nr:NADH dehydrogenase subunit 4L [Entylia carinata]APU51897.1 NADH dehydrogenase subunit 4L [Entylia carinata]